MRDTRQGKESERVAGIVLAAGASSRMGTPKQLLPVGADLLLERVLEQCLRSHLDLVVLVLGFKADEIRSRIRYGKDFSRFKIVKNPDFKRGISSSILTGLSFLEKDYDHVMILLGDMPRLTSGIINRLLSAYFESGRPLGALEVRGRRSHPVIIGRSFFPELHRLTGDQGARDLFISRRDQVCLVDPGREYDDSDIDTYEDYLKFKKTLE